MFALRGSTSARWKFQDHRIDRRSFPSCGGSGWVESGEIGKVVWLETRCSWAFELRYYQYFEFQGSKYKIDDRFCVFFLVTFFVTQYENKARGLQKVKCDMRIAVGGVRVTKRKKKNRVRLSPATWKASHSWKERELTRRFVGLEEMSKTFNFGQIH